MVKNSRSVVFIVTVLALLWVPATARHRHRHTHSNFDFSGHPVPDTFRLGDRYPDREEMDVCRPIFNHIDRNSVRFRNELVLDNSSMTFDNVDARWMTSRMYSRLNRLRQLYTAGFTVLKAWTQYPDSEVQDLASLHYEGRTIRVRVHDQSLVSRFLTRAVQAAFDWVTYEDAEYVRLSVIPDNCENNVDMVFVLDQSGSVGYRNHGLAIQFILNVIQFFSISLDATRVGFVAFSAYSHLEFDLDKYTSAQSLNRKIRYIQYRGGSTATALGLNTTALILNPANNHGARPASKGIPKVAILITDGKSNRYPLTYAVPYIKSLGVQVYAIGIARPDVAELQFISSDPDNQHVFLLNSYNDAAGFVDFLSIRTCDTPAIVDPGDNTTTDIPEDGTRYFQVECDSFSNTVLVELHDNVGTSFLYCSATEKNPGPLTSNTTINDTLGITTRTCLVSLDNTRSRVVYIGVQGHEGTNQFTVVVWDLLFTPDREEIVVFVGETGTVYDVSTKLNSAANGIEFEYNIIEDSSGGIFSINNNGEVIVGQSGLSFGSNSLYQLLIVAENRDKSCQRSRFKLDIRVGMDQITFPTPLPVAILETASIGEEVTTIVATGGAGQIKYSIVNDSVPFKIGSATGTITVNGSLNFEDEMEYIVIVNADSVDARVSGSATQVIYISDVNEQPVWVTPCAQAGSCEAEILENQAPRDVGDRLDVVDDDLSSLPNGQINYQLRPLDADLPFSIDNDGQVRTTQVLDREAREVYSFTVVAKDSGTPSLSVTTTFRVRVKDVNDKEPTFIQGPTELTIPENEPVENVIAQYIATDGDTAPNAQITYSLSPTTTPFILNSENGALSIRKKIDFEDPMSRMFQITVTANNPPLSNTITTQITIEDVNDNAPIFEREIYAYSVPEHSVVSTPVGMVRATDADSGSNGDVRYSISGGNSQGAFSIDNKMGAITIYGDIDREQVEGFELTIRARDRGSPRLSSFARVNVTITDINDHPPVFNPDFYDVSLRENRQNGTIAFTVMAIDADKPETDNSRIEYNILQGNVGNAFSIDSDSGVVIVSSVLNHESIPSYTLTIQAVDHGNPQMSANATAEVTVINVNEAPPSLSDDQSVDIQENTPTGVVIASFSVNDPDFMPVSINILSGNDEGKFEISNSGVISLVDMLDFETTQSYMLTIQASDGETTDEASLKVNVVDVNEYSPNFVGPTLFTVDEELPAGTLIGIVTATDGDGSAPNNEITYVFSMHNNIQGYFILNNRTGEIITASVLDREMLIDIFPESSLSVLITARDGGSPPRQSSRLYTITLRDINDNDPIFGDNMYSNSIFENQPSQVILLFSATDADLGTNADIRFSFIVDPPEGMSLFELADNRIGNLSSTQPLDCEIQTSYKFIITASDLGNPARNTSVPGVLTLRDQNDNDPIFTANPYIFYVYETAGIETIVGQVTANDSDKGSNGEVSYEIIGQDDLVEESESIFGGKPFFRIDSDTGEIRHVTPFNFEAFSKVNLTIRANDRGTPRRSSTAEVVFAVRNVDESAPRFTSSCRNVFLSEDTPLDSLIVNCIAFDEDNTTTADDAEWITYVIESGNTGNTFSIGLHTGEIRNAIELDFEMTNFFRLYISATDGSGRSTRRRIDIELIDVNDNAPQFQSLSYSFAMTSERIVSNTQMVARVEASDSDTGRYGEVTYLIPENGIEHVSPNETRITVIARDGAVPPQISSVTLIVKFDGECLLQNYKVDPTSGEVMAYVLCSIQIDPENTDVVMGNNHTAHCRILGNSAAKYQWLLNGNSIDLLPDKDQEAVLNVKVDGFQDGGEYACKVTTEAGSLQTSTYTVNILVVPIITVPPQPTAVKEGHSMELKCHAIGTPSPMIRWEHEDKVVGTGNTLNIEKAGLSDQGDYYCVAISVAGSSSAVARLTVFVKDDVAKVIINNIDQTSSDGTCHYLDPKILEKVVMSFSGVSTMVTGISADNLCEINGCSPNPCRNGGNCQLDDSVPGGYQCICAEGYTGVDCIDDINECPEGPCGPSGVCTNTPGRFHCTCSDGNTGNRCQYPTTCTNTSCSDGELCLESLIAPSGHICVVIDADTMLTVNETKIDHGFLDEMIVNYRETLLQLQIASSRRKRLSNDTLADFTANFCDPRFVQLDPADGSRYVLIWDCPPGEPSPPQDIQTNICEVVVEAGVVASCRANNMTLLTPATPPASLPRISATIELIQLDSSGEPLSIGETLNNLKAIAEQLEKSGILPGIEVESVTAINPITCTSECVNGECTDRDTCTCDKGWTGPTCDKEQQGKLSQQENIANIVLIVGVVIAVVVCIVLSVVVVIIIINKYKQHKKRKDQKRNHAKELQDMETRTPALKQMSPAHNHPPRNESVESRRISSIDQFVANPAYELLPVAMTPSTVKLADENDYDEVPIRVNTSPYKEKTEGK